MTNITLAVPDELKKQLQKHDEVNWSAVIRRALQEHLHKLEIVEAIASKSKFTEEDAEEIGNKIKHEIAKRHKLVK